MVNPFRRQISKEAIPDQEIAHLIGCHSSSIEPVTQVPTCSPNEGPHGFLLPHRRGIELLTERFRGTCASAEEALLDGDVGGLVGWTEVMESPGDFTGQEQVEPVELLLFWRIEDVAQVFKLGQPVAEGPPSSHHRADMAADGRSWA